MREIYIIKFKKMIFPLIFLIFTACLVIFSQSNLAAAKTGLSLWANSVIPSLFPFFVATELLSHTNIVHILGKFLTPYMKPLFHIRGEGGFAFLMGILSGYPMGAKIAVNFREKGICSKEECERLLSFTNNSGPLFIIGTVGVSIFGSASLGFLFFVTHLLASISVGFIFRFWKYKPSKNYDTATTHSSSNYHNFNNASIDNTTEVSLSNLGEIIGNSITNSISTILMIGGFVVLFSVIVSVLNASNLLSSASHLLGNILSISPNFISAFFTGIFEITNGISLIAPTAISSFKLCIVATSFVLGFGGFSVLLQVWSVVAKSDLSILPYVYGKLLQGLFAGFYTFLALSYFIIA